MKTTIRRALRLAYIFCALGTMNVSADALLNAIAAIETNAKPSFNRSKADHKVGRKGERSRYQIMPYVWRSYTTSRDYTNPSVASEVALKIIRDRITAYQKTHKEPIKPSTIWLLWNAPSANSYSKEQLETAIRFSNIYLANLSVK